MSRIITSLTVDLVYYYYSKVHKASKLNQNLVVKRDFYYLWISKYQQIENQEKTPLDNVLTSKSLGVSK
jgi:hypothetical protein